jgi:hydrogenase maturation factor
LGLKNDNIVLCIQKIKMLENTDGQMDALELAEKAKKQNIIDMAVGFTAMMPLFQERSANLIKEKLTDLFEGLPLCQDSCHL